MGLLDDFSTLSDNAKQYALNALARFGNGVGDTVQAIPGNAQKLAQGLLNLPQQVGQTFSDKPGGLFSPQLGQQVNQAMSQPQPANPSQWMDKGMALAGMAPVGGLIGMTKGADGLFGAVDNGVMGKANNPWKTKDVFGDGRQIEHVSPDGRSAVVQQTLPSGKTVFYPADVNAQYGWVSPDLYKPFDSFDAAQKKIKGMRISDAAKARNTERYGGIPSHWTGDAKKLAKSLIDNDVPISRFSGSTQSKSKYIELADGRKIRMSDHDLPMSYDAADIDFRYGNDITEIINKLK